MPRIHHPSLSLSHRRLCVYCGYRGTPVQDVHASGLYECPRCGGDLYARPPMSYAQMEGLDQPAGVRAAILWFAGLLGRAARVIGPTLLAAAMLPLHWLRSRRVLARRGRTIVAGGAASPRASHRNPTHPQRPV